MNRESCHRVTQQSERSLYKNMLLQSPEPNDIVVIAASFLFRLRNFTISPTVRSPITGAALSSWRLTFRTSYADCRSPRGNLRTGLIAWSISLLILFPSASHCSRVALLLHSWVPFFYFAVRGGLFVTRPNSAATRLKINSPTRWSLSRVPFEPDSHYRKQWKCLQTIRHSQSKVSLAISLPIMRWENHLIARLEEAKERLRSENFALFAAALLASRDSGGRLNETVDRISHSVRELQRLERKVQSDTAMARKSANYMALTPFFILIAYYFVDSQAVANIFVTTIGQILLATAIILNIIAYFWARHILNPDI